MIKNEIIKKKRKFIFLVILLTLILTLAALLSVSLGAAAISIDEIIDSILCGFRIQSMAGSGLQEGIFAIVWNVRIPRILLAAVVGSGLAVSGAVFQAILMNPLADSYTIGVSSGAAFGATLALFFNLFFPGIEASVIIFAFLGAGASLLLVISLSSVDGKFNSLNLIIAGIITTSILSSAISLLKSLSGEKVAVIIFWLLGNLNAKNWNHVLISYVLVVPSVFILGFLSQKINILSLGDREAQSLGIDVKKTRLVILVLSSLISAVCVTFSGIIGFIGLIIPHLCRFALGADNRQIIPLSALGGALILIAADSFVRLFSHAELPVGVITTLIGGPFFIYIFIRYRRRFG